jgi:hypothetical protein
VVLNFVFFSDLYLRFANAVEWELKAQKKGTSLVTLFHLEPSPKAHKFVPSKRGCYLS